MRGDCGIFAKDQKPVGGFFAWEMRMNPVRIGLDGNSPVYRVSHYRLTLKNWWLSAAGIETVKAVFCRVVDGCLIPVLEDDIATGDYEPGRSNKELIIEKAMNR
jgi:hypothetical protein